ncbi:K+/H+ antiporter [Odoribacter laneus]|uniref:potassium/proton antiporter n=1 Tax=Odoribacter laneus TaxID=626933 RepID=UPI0018994AB2|nr:potassium/proton antiporter [Odoribacter laneus]GKI22540.1 K+/H+ antiporter [Odoribacter laneus]GKI24983.1 K+/H+ antiporter [Odoribacter laneus]
MIVTTGNILLIGSTLLFVSLIIGRTGYKLGIPVLLLFLIVGMIFGSDGVGIQFHNAGEAQFIGTLSLCIILFAGGMDTKINDIRPIIPQGVILATVGVLLTTFITGYFIYWLIGSLYPSMAAPLVGCLLLAAVMSSTDSASVFNILRSKSLNLKQNMRPLLELESGSNDPMAYMLTILLLQIIQSGDMSWGQILLSFFMQFSIGIIMGYVLGRIAVYIINHVCLMNNSLYQVILLTFLFFTFSITDLLNGNGYLAVYLAGLVIGNHRIVYKKNIANFFDGLAWLFQIIMFLSLGLLVNPKDLWGVAHIGLLIGIFLIFIARPLAVFLCLLPFRKMTLPGRIFVSWIGLRGAVPIIFATYPLLADIEGASQIFNIVFFITILSLLIQGTTVSGAARMLGLAHLAQEKPNEFDMELSEDIKSIVAEASVMPDLLTEGDRLQDLHFPQNTLVIMIKRYENYFVPNGHTRLLPGDKLLLLSDNEEELRHTLAQLGIEEYTLRRN